MKRFALGYFLACIFLAKVQSRPQITKLFPLEELAAFSQRTDDLRPLDKLIGKLRATYDFVFRKPEDTSNVARILDEDSVKPDGEALKLIWASLGPRLLDNGSATADLPLDRALDKAPEPENNLEEEEEDKAQAVGAASKDDWLDGIEAPKPLGQLELQEDEDDDSKVEAVTPQSSLQLPGALGRQLLDWLGSLLGLTYGAYAKLAQSIHGVRTD